MGQLGLTVGSLVLAIFVDVLKVLESLNREEVVLALLGDTLRARLDQVLQNNQ